MKRARLPRIAAALALLSCLCLGSPGAARAELEVSRQPSGELSLEELVRSVEQSFPLLRAAEQDRVLADADRLSAEGGFDPAVRIRGTSVPYGGYRNDRVEVSVDQPTSLWGTRVFGGWRYGGGSFAPYDGKYETADYGEVRIGAQVPLWRDGPIDRRRAGIQRAEIGTSVAKLSVAEQRLLMVRAASMRYWDWVAAGRRVEISRELLAMATTRDAQLAARVERGDLPAYERAENLRVMHQREAQVAAATRGLENAAIELSLYLRDDRGLALRPDRSRLPAALPPVTGAGTGGAGGGATPAGERAERTALEQRPEPKRYEAMMAQSRVDLALAENQRKPGVDVVVMGAKDLGPGPPKIVPTELELSLMLDIPILTRVQDGRKQAAEAQLTKLTEQARYARDRVTADVRDALSAISLAHDRAAAARREVDVARGLVDSERERFTLGDSTLLMVNLREQAYAEAEMREVDAVAEHHRGTAALRAATGQGKP